MRKADLKLDVKPLLRTIFRQYFGNYHTLVDTVVSHLPPPNNAAATKLFVTRYYTGPQDSSTADAVCNADANGPLVMHVVKQYHRRDYVSFHSLARVLSGTVKVGQRVRVLGEQYSLEDEEDSAEAVIKALFIGECRYHLPISSATPGMWVLVEGIDNVITKVL